MRRFTLLLFSLLVVLIASPVYSQTLAERFAGVKRWELRYSYTMNSPFAWEEGGYHHDRHTWAETERGMVVLETESSGNDVIQLRGKGTVFATLDQAMRKTGLGGYIQTRWDRGNGTPTTTISVDLYLDEGKYEIGILSGDWDAQYGGREKWSMNDNKYGPLIESIHINVPTPAPAEKTLKLPEAGRVISGSFSWEERWNSEAQREPSFDRNRRARVDPMQGTVRWTLVPADATNVELVVEPQGYDDWLPQGGKSEREAGNTLAITATLVAKGAGGPPDTKARRMTYQLIDASAEPGVCLNLPISGATTAYDLGFEADKNNGDWKIGGDGTSITSSDGDYESTTANLSSFDWGAYGQVVVTAELTDGRVVVGHLKNSDRREILIPKRDSKSKIADKWKSTMNFSGGDDDDEDRQDRNDHRGDGLTAYEEYRGLIASGAHTRTRGLGDPTKKDVVVINEIGGEARSGLALFERASGIRVIEMAKGELPESRRVNVNQGSAFRGGQHALWLTNGDLKNSAVGENWPADVYGKTPVKSERVVIDLAYARKSYDGQADVSKKAGEAMPYTYQEDVDNTIAHEIAHGIGAPHHGKDADYHGPREVTVKMKDWSAYGVDGVQKHPTEDKPVKLNGNIGRPGCDASGDAGCIMCYTNYYQWAAVGPPGGPYRYYAIALQPVGKTFCTSAKGTGMNAPRKIGDVDLPGFFGDAVGQSREAPAGNCLGAMNVRDW